MRMKACYQRVVSINEDNPERSMERERERRLIDVVDLRRYNLGDRQEKKLVWTSQNEARDENRKRRK